MDSEGMYSAEHAQPAQKEIQTLAKMPSFTPSAGIEIVPSSTELSV